MNFICIIYVKFNKIIFPIWIFTLPASIYALFLFCLISFPLFFFLFHINFIINLNVQEPFLYVLVELFFKVSLDLVSMFFSVVFLDQVFYLIHCKFFLHCILYVGHIFRVYLFSPFLLPLFLLCSSINRGCLCWA